MNRKTDYYQAKWQMRFKGARYICTTVIIAALHIPASVYGASLGFGLDTGKIYLSNSTVPNLGLSDSAPFFQIDARYKLSPEFAMVSVGGGVTYYFFKDEAPFTNLTDIGEIQAETEGVGFLIERSLHKPVDYPLATALVGLRLGLASITGYRRIAGCEGCDSDWLSIHDGPYMRFDVNPFYVEHNQGGIGFNCYYVRYFSSRYANGTIGVGLFIQTNDWVERPCRQGRAPVPTGRAVFPHPASP